MQPFVLSKLLLVLILTLAASAAESQSAGGDFTIQSHTIDGGGGASSGSVFTLLSFEMLMAPTQ